MKEKQRLDTALVERALAESREKAKALIMAGIVYVNQQKQDNHNHAAPKSQLLADHGKYKVCLLF